MKYIQKIAVLGAGVMGAQIAAHCVNAGIQTLLYDLPTEGKDKNALIDKAITNLTRLKPSPLALPSMASLIQAKNYDDNLEELKHCDLIIEAIAERLELKEALYERVAPMVTDTAFLVTNTSGLSLQTLAEVLPKSLRPRFCGMHFFNPPRYLPLVELIPSKETSKENLDFLETWLCQRLGKSVVRAKDTPNFIANRVGVFSLLSVMHHAAELNLGFDEVDALTGPLIGRPKSATFRTMDVVGLDTMAQVVKTMWDKLKDDPWHELFVLPPWFDELIKARSLGQKSGQGIYRKQGQVIEVYDVGTGQYRPSSAVLDEEVQQIFKLPDWQARWKALLAAKGKQAKFLVQYFQELFKYTAHHLEHIANSSADVDAAMRWGFAWEKGPFEMAALMGLKSEKSKRPSPARPKVVWENTALRLTATDDIAVMSFKTKGNTIGQAVLDGWQEIIAVIKANYAGLIIHQDDLSNFSMGADLREIAALMHAGRWRAIQDMVAQFQSLLMQWKTSPFPTVAAVSGRALGGGVELILHCDAVVAAFESYLGLVETAVGIIPAGGGSKELALRASLKAKQMPLFPFIQAYFEQVAMARVSDNAIEAKAMGYLCAEDSILMPKTQVLPAAIAKVKSLLAANFSPGIPQKFQVAGREGRARLQLGLVNWLQGGFISAHDYTIASHLAHVLCGGEVNEGELVDEAWILNLELEALMALIQDPLTQARIDYRLESGKVLRN